MKLFLITLACAIVYVTAECENVPDNDNLSMMKCMHTLVFRGKSVSSISSNYMDAELDRWFYRKDTFEVFEVFKGELPVGSMESNKVLVMFNKKHSDTECSNYPYGENAENVIVFAMWNEAYSIYQVLPCTQNPPFHCLTDEDQAAFRGVNCDGAGAAV